MFSLVHTVLHATICMAVKPWHFPITLKNRTAISRSVSTFPEELENGYFAYLWRRITREVLNTVTLRARDRRTHARYCRRDKHTLTDNLVPRVFHLHTSTSLSPFRVGRWETMGTRLANRRFNFHSHLEKKETERMHLGRVCDVMIDENAINCKAHPSSI